MLTAINGLNPDYILPFFENGASHVFEGFKAQIFYRGNALILLCFMGKIDFKNSYFDDIKSWISSSGKIDIKKLILNWKPLVLVSKGTLNIDENFSSDLKLLSTSNGMLETLDIAENEGLFDKKGVFVAKIILGNKATPSSENDGTYTIISPINWSKQGLTLESVPLISYQQTENKNSQN